MTDQRLGIIMHGVTGRMGMNQHLVRSILAIRDQGGVMLSNGDRVVVDPVLVGRNREKISFTICGHDGQLRQRRINTGMIAQEALDPPVLQRMKADHAETTTATKCGRFTQYVYALFERCAQLLKFAVDKDADRLERARRRVDPRALLRHGARDYFGQLSGSPDGRLVACTHDRARYACREALLTIGFEDSSQFLFIHCCEPLGGADACIRVHSHVQRAVAEEAEATACFVQLWR